MNAALGWNDNFSINYDQVINKAETQRRVTRGELRTDDASEPCLSFCRSRSNNALLCLLEEREKMEN